jgi:hypothetical protein
LTDEEKKVISAKDNTVKNKYIGGDFREESLHIKQGDVDFDSLMKKDKPDE